ncbi:MAG: Ca-activated chloride channel family protein [Desulforhopalus sp.]|jgi:Ca-activated chloride channel family protein
MTEFHLLRPYWLLAIIPIVLIWFQYRKLRLAETRFRKLIDPHLLEHLLVGEVVKKRVTPLNVLLVVLVFAAIALSGPTYRQEASPFAGDDAGLMVLMKLSKSMSSKDLQPSRLERAKQKLWDLLEQRRGKSTGLIVYSGSSHLVMPLTSDAKVITTMIEDLTPELMPKEGDDLAGAITLGERMIGQSGKPGSILIMADSVASSQLSLLEKMESAISFQIFSFNPPSSGIDPVLLKSAEVLRSRPVEVSLDSSDVELLARRAGNSLTQITDSEKSERWRDDGYWLLPLIACCFLLWSRKGWVVR